MSITTRLQELPRFHFSRKRRASPKSLSTRLAAETTGCFDSFYDMLQIVEWAWFQLSLPLNSGWYILYVETIWGNIKICITVYIYIPLYDVHMCTLLEQFGWFFVYIKYLSSIYRSFHLLAIQGFIDCWQVNLPPLLTYPPQKQGFNEALLGETLVYSPWSGLISGGGVC